MKRKAKSQPVTEALGEAKLGSRYKLDNRTYKLMQRPIKKHHKEPRVRVLQNIDNAKDIIKVLNKEMIKAIQSCT